MSECTCLCVLVLCRVYSSVWLSFLRAGVTEQSRHLSLSGSALSYVTVQCRPRGMEVGEERGCA